MPTQRVGLLPGSVSTPLRIRFHYRVSRRVYLVHHRRGSRMPVVRRFLDAVHFIHKPVDQIVRGRLDGHSARVITDISSESVVGPDLQPPEC